MAAMRKVSGTARPAVVALAWGLMFAAMLGAISATDRPTAAHTDSERLSPGAPEGLASICSSSLCLVPIVSLRPVRHGRGETLRTSRVECARAQ